jgi:2-polyprenyl-6-methoxyphenol hydroxylase-like FAD-dependent oxidoreductase
LQDVVIIGGGPAGIATAIAARLKGFCVTVIDARKPPIDKPCGEGVLPEAVDALRHLGVELDSKLLFRFSGFQFSDESSSACAQIPAGKAFGIRRTVFHRLLVDRALDLGVNFLWGTRLARLDSRGAETSVGFIASRWLVGADGSSSNVRRFAGLEPRRAAHFRFGFRRHFEIAPWTDQVEVHWGEKCQLVLTPTGPREICISLFASDSRLRLGRALDAFPAVGRRVATAQPASTEAGTATMLSKAHAATRGNVALVGDASCTVDGIAGQGLSLAFQQAIELAEALSRGDLGHYAAAHARIARIPERTTRLLLAMNASSVLRRKALRLFAANPAIFARMISIHTGASSPDALNTSEMLGLGWRVMWA